MLMDKLVVLGKSFEVDTVKSIFPYKFYTEDHLFYVGSTPDIKFYEDILTQEYNKNYSYNWSFYDETVKYLNKDLHSLYEIMIKANKRIFMDYDVNIVGNITISGLAMRIFLKNYYKDNIPNINKSSIYRDIKQAYYGGIT